MALTLDSTYGGKYANTYLLLAAANTLIEDTVLRAEAWAAADDTTKNKALVQATRHIDSYNFSGNRYYYNQRLIFPRVPSQTSWGIGPYGGLGEPDANFLTVVENDEYLRKQKLRVETACALQAVFVLQATRNLEREAQYKGITSHSESRAGVSQSQSYGNPSHRLCPEAMDELRYYRSSPRLVRGSGPGLEYYD